MQIQRHKLNHLIPKKPNRAKQNWYYSTLATIVGSQSTLIYLSQTNKRHYHIWMGWAFQQKFNKNYISAAQQEKNSMKVQPTHG